MKFILAHNWHYETDMKCNDTHMTRHIHNDDLCNNLLSLTGQQSDMLNYSDWMIHSLHKVSNKLSHYTRSNEWRQTGRALNSY